MLQKCKPPNWQNVLNLKRWKCMRGLNSKTVTKRKGSRTAECHIGMCQPCKLQLIIWVRNFNLKQIKVWSNRSKNSKSMIYAWIFLMPDSRWSLPELLSLVATRYQNCPTSVIEVLFERWQRSFLDRSHLERDLALQQQDSLSLCECSGNRAMSDALLKTCFQLNLRAILGHFLITFWTSKTGRTIRLLNDTDAFTRNHSQSLANSSVCDLWKCNFSAKWLVAMRTLRYYYVTQ